jgi:hypothetical protein
VASPCTPTSGIRFMCEPVAGSPFDKPGPTSKEIA